MRAILATLAMLLVASGVRSGSGEHWAGPFAITCTGFASLSANEAGAYVVGALHTTSLVIARLEYEALAELAKYPRPIPQLAANQMQIETWRKGLGAVFAEALAKEMLTACEESPGRDDPVNFSSVLVETFNTLRASQLAAEEEM